MLIPFVSPNCPLPSGNWTDEDPDFTVTLVFPQEMDQTAIPPADEFRAFWNGVERLNLIGSSWTSGFNLLLLFETTPGPPQQMYIDHLVANSNLKCLDGSIVPTWNDLDIGDGL